VVKSASIQTFIKCAHYLLKNGNEPIRLKDLERSGASHFMVAEFLDFGVHFGLLELIMGRKKRQLTYKLSPDGLEFYKSLIGWDARLRKNVR